MNAEEQAKQSQLFTLRVWMEEVGDGRCEVRGQMKHVLSGETSYFREWPDLLALLQQHLTGAPASDKDLNQVT